MLSSAGFFCAFNKTLEFLFNWETEVVEMLSPYSPYIDSLIVVHVLSMQEEF